MENPIRGLLAVWTDIEPAAEADFNDWYNREHLRERVEVPGFINARRYGSTETPHRYFAAYDTDTLAVLGSAPYVAALQNQTPLSLRMFTHFRNTTRVIAGLGADHDAGVGDRALGGAMVTVRFKPVSGNVAALARTVDESIATPLATCPDVVRVCVALGVEAAVDDPTVETALRAADSPDTVALLVEGAALESLRQAVDAQIASAGIPEADATIVQRESYRLLCALIR